MIQELKIGSLYALEGTGGIYNPSIYQYDKLLKYYIDGNGMKGYHRLLDFVDNNVFLFLGSCKFNWPTGVAGGGGDRIYNMFLHGHNKLCMSPKEFNYMLIN